MTSIKSFIRTTINAFYHMKENDGFEHAGNLAFLTLLAFLPFLLFFSSIAGYVSDLAGDFDINKYFLDAIYNQFPKETLEVFKSQITTIASAKPKNLVTLIVLSAIWISSSFIEGLRTALNRVYKVNSPPIYVLGRLLSIIHCIVLTCITVIIVFIFSAISLLKSRLPELTALWPYFRYFIIPLTMLLGVSLIYFIVPNVNNSWKHIAPGAVFAVLLWYIAAILFIEYTKYAKFMIIYGSIAGNILFLMFFYILHICLIYGAAFNTQLKQNF